MPRRRSRARRGAWAASQTSLKGMARLLRWGEKRYATAAVWLVKAASSCQGAALRPSPISTNLAPAAR